MTLIKRSHFAPTMPHLFDDYFTRDVSKWKHRNYSATNTTLPSVNIREDHDGFLVEMAAPGMSKKDFEIQLDNETLTISSHTRDDSGEGEYYTKRAFSYQSFHRSFLLPKSVVDHDRIEAKYELGILRILIPKREEAKQLPPRQISVR